VAGIAGLHGAERQPDVQRLPAPEALVTSSLPPRRIPWRERPSRARPRRGRLPDRLPGRGLRAQLSPAIQYVKPEAVETLFATHLAEAARANSEDEVTMVRET
jgi:hypothetical protein